MMDQASRLRLQAGLDGELSPAEASEVERLSESEPEARALAEEIRTSKQALAVFEAETKVPASREFYWSGIRRQILALEQPVTAPSRPAVGWFALLRQYLVPAGVASVFLIAGLMATIQVRTDNARHAVRLEASVSSPGSFTYRDFSSGVTLVWLPYPAEKEFAEIDSILKIP